MAQPIYRRGKRVILGTPLTPQQLRVTALVGEGLPTKGIARIMGLEPGTVKVYLSYIFNKTGASNRTELALWWLKKCGEMKDNERQPES
jgi:DNA-binding NarL/FixJ family response regulator